MIQLRFETGPRSGELVSISKSRTKFGRSSASDCVLNHPTVSRDHFYIEKNAGKIFIVDEGSNNGTRVNGLKVNWVELKPGDRIEAGPFILMAEDPDAQQPAEDISHTPESAKSGSLDRQRVDQAFHMYPREYLEGIEHFNEGRYFEAHEIWEEIWLRSSGETKLFYQMLIQAAVGFHHYSRGNERGARGMYKAVIEKTGKLSREFMALDVSLFEREFKAFFETLISGEDGQAGESDRVPPILRLQGEA